MLTTVLPSQMPKSAVQCEPQIRSLVEGHELTQAQAYCLNTVLEPVRSCASVASL
jgi:hypothetical protein